jgi:hypothetical protein
MKFSFLPTKNIKINKTLFFIGGIIIDILKATNGITLNQIYDYYKKNKISKNNFVKIEVFILTLDYLFAINAIQEKEGEVFLI